MAVKHYLTPELRKALKQPLGTLIRGSFVDTMKRLKKMVEQENPTSIISVGDTVSKNLAENGFSPKLFIIDNKCMRRSTKPFKLPADRTVYITNPRGTITDEAEQAIEAALKQSEHVKIVVKGEEDLLALAAIAHASEDSYVIYGQPHEGIVVVKVTPDKKTEITSILNSMEKRSKS
ncbi:MAG: DUF359 domain-containing protein [Candidatus Bathyarchaeia archaeon]